MSEAVFTHPGVMQYEDTSATDDLLNLFDDNMNYVNWNLALNPNLKSTSSDRISIYTVWRRLRHGDLFCFLSEVPVNQSGSTVDAI